MISARKIGLESIDLLIRTYGRCEIKDKITVFREIDISLIVGHPPNKYL